MMGIAVGAVALTTTACHAYTNGRPSTVQKQFLATPTRHHSHSGVDGLENETHDDACVWPGDDDDGNNASCQDSLLEGGATMKWTFSPRLVGVLAGLASLLLGAYYYYFTVMDTEKDDEKKAGADSKQPIGKDGVSSSTSSSANSSSTKSTTTTTTTTKCPIRETARQQGLVLYDGHWYSVAKFVPHHPGGEEVLHQYLGSDISFVFRVMHRDPMSIMKKRRPVRAATEEEVKALSSRREEVSREMMEDYRATQDVVASHVTPMGDSNKFDLAAFEKDVMELYDLFVKEGYFKPSLFWLIHKTALVLSFLALSIVLMKVIPENNILAGISLGLFWHQSGYLMHDTEHHNAIGNERVNDILGWMYGTVFLGVNGAWWREEHREHHALLNTFDEKGFKDPQMREDVWIQNKKLIPFFGEETIHFLANFQHILFLPIIFLAGRFGIVIDSTVTERKFRPWTILGNVFHVLLHWAVLRQTNYPVQVYFFASCQQAMLSLQLLGNHYTKPWNTVVDATEGNFCVWQVLGTQDFAVYNWMRWYFGGLNFHYSHHLFPTLPREYFHMTTPHIQKLCRKHGLPNVEIGFIDCVVGMVTNFKDVKNDFAKHGSGSLTLMYT